MNQNEITRTFAAFENKKVLIIGDVMIDAYLIGKVNRISPEAPVPIVSVADRESRLGGAANVAINVNALGAKTIMASVISDDEKADEYLSLMDKVGLDTSGILRSKRRKTTKKTRIISNYQQLLRVDDEEIKELEGADLKLFKARIKKILDDDGIDVIVFQDYNKGIITPGLIDFVVSEAERRKIPVTADPKKKNFDAFNRVTLFKPNLKELAEGLGREIKPVKKDLDAAAKELIKNMGIGAMLVTLSERGVFISNGQDSAIFRAHLRNIADVSGAGDTVIAVASLCLTTNVSFEDMAKIANLAGGLVCEKVGVVPVDKERLMEEAISYEK